MEEESNSLPRPRLARRRSSGGGSPLLLLALFNQQVSGDERFRLFGTLEFQYCTPLHSACMHGHFEAALRLKSMAGVKRWYQVLMNLDEAFLLSDVEKSGNAEIHQWLKSEFESLHRRRSMLAEVQAHKPVDDGAAPVANV